MVRDLGANIGGLLILLVVAVGVLTPLAQLGSVIALLKATSQLETYFGQRWPTYRALTLCIIGLRAVICVYVAGQLMYDRNPKTPRIAIIGIWISYGLLGAISLSVAAALSPISADLIAISVRMFWPIAICLVVHIYLATSKRVARTYNKSLNI